MYKKKNGAYYTPDFLAKFIMNYITPQFANSKSISFLEPSVGDGSFIKAFNETQFPKAVKSFSFHAVEKVKPELIKAQAQANKNRKRNTKFSFVKNDFLKYQAAINRKFSIIAGNPPYIKKSLLKKNQIALCKEIHKEANLPESSVKNIWSSFLISCSRKLNDDGIMAFVLPAELLQVKFSKSLRSYLLTQFERIEIFTFNELMFDQIGQDTIILFCFKKAMQKGQFYAQVENIEQLENKSFKLAPNDPLVKSDIKWTHHILTGDDIEIITKLKNEMSLIPHYCDSKPGIVTAANKYFIIDEQTANEYALKGYSKPIIQKGLYVNGSVVFDQTALRNISLLDRPTKLLCFPEQPEHTFSNSVVEYLNIGKKQLIDKRYKCMLRNYWFVVPNIETPPEGFFFKRCHLYPKLLKNEAKAFVTDSAYKISMKENFSIEGLVYSFYNSLTLAFAEIEGRYYGGGVLELTPSEFKKLPIPFVNISNNEFDRFKKTFESKNQIEDVLLENDRKILQNKFKLSSEDVCRIQAIRNKLISKRLRNK